MAQLDAMINRLFTDVAERMIAKLYLDYYDVEEIARFAGLTVARIEAVISRLPVDV